MANTANANDAADETFNSEIRKNRVGLVLTSFVELASEQPWLDSAHAVSLRFSFD